MKTTTFKTNNYTVGIKYVEIDPKLYDLKLLSQPGGSPKSISDFYNSVNNAEVAINGSIFNDKTGQYEEGYGCLNSFGVLRGSFSGNTPSIGMIGNSLKLEWIYNDVDIHDRNTKFLLNSAYYAFLFDGVVSPHIGDGYTEGTKMYDNEEIRSMIGQKKDGTIIFAVTYLGKMTGEDQGNFLKSMGYSIGFNLDGGLSSNIICNGEKAIGYSRNILDAFVAVKKNDSPTPDPTLSGISLKAQNTPFRVRSSVVNGTELVMVPVGSSAQILQFIPGFQSDGYQWAYVEYNGIKGYSQLDTSSDYLIQKSVSASTVYLKASKLQFRIRSNPVNGTQLALVPVGGQARIVSTNTAFSSDGYQWAYVDYNGTFGYSQLDLQNAYTIVE